jgi:hypothetical protein
MKIRDTMYSSIDVLNLALDMASCPSSTSREGASLDTVEKSLYSYWE